MAGEEVEVLAVGGAVFGVVVADLGVGSRAGRGVDGVGAPEDADGVSVGSLDGELDSIDICEALPDALYTREIGITSAHI